MADTGNWLNTFKPISLEQMDEVALLNRTDTKYVFSAQNLRSLLTLLGSDYQALEIKGKRMAHYRTVYFDTPELLFYYQHQNGKTNRIKIRCRKYVDSDLCFLEQKFKNNKGRTIKTRIRVPDFVKQLGEEHREALKIDRDLVLNHTLWNSFDRITLVNHSIKERLTIDTHLKFDFAGKETNATNLVVCEVKQDGVNHLSPVIRALKNLHIRPMRISKYCIGMALLNPGIKQNNFKEKVLKINKIQHELVA